MSKVVLSGYDDQQLRRTLRAISLTENPTVVGSAKYLAHRYPGDFDVFESAISKMGRDDAALEFAILISNIGKIISVDHTIQMTDFKAGEDVRFKYKPLYKDNSLEELTHFSDFLDNQVDNFNDRELRKIRNMDYEEAVEMFRLLANPHWTLDEVIEGKKILQGGKTLLLSEAIKHNARVKLDSVSWFESRLQAVEIVYSMGYTNKDGKSEYYYDMGDYTRGIISDINMYKKNNPLKTMKRLWSLSVFVKCDQLIADLEKVFSTDAAALNQILADIETLKKVREPLDKIVIMALEFKKRLQNHLTPEEFKTELLYEFSCKCSQIYDMWIQSQSGKKFNYDLYMEYLNWLEDFLKRLINKKSQPFYDMIKRNDYNCLDKLEIKL